ncbi:GAF domain-containing sensor histidine kinase, partial [Halorhodospira sp. M38]
YAGRDADPTGLRRQRAARTIEPPNAREPHGHGFHEGPGGSSRWRPLRRLRTLPTPTHYPDTPHASASSATEQEALHLLSALGVVAAQARDLDELLEHGLARLIEQTGAAAAAVRLFDEQGYLRLVEANGLNAGFIDAERRQPAEGCPCAIAGERTAVQFRGDLRQCIRRSGCNPLPNRPQLAMLAVPILDPGGNGVGIYNLYFEPHEAQRWMHPPRMLEWIGRQLGAAIARIREEYRTHHSALQEERNLLAHELHDTVAQEVATLRLRVRQLEERVSSGADTEALLAPLEDLRTRLDHTNDQVRTVMQQFRTQALGTPLETALSRLVNRFSRDSGIEVRLIHRWPELALGEREQLHIHRIVEEALSNAWHHGGARNVRLQLETPGGDLCLLIEDDGGGFVVDEVPDSDPTQPRGHGLRGMRERARHLGAILSVESEPGQGTAIHLRLPQPQRLTWTTKSLHQAGFNDHAYPACR